jgi:GGDEF domain-containing protein
MHIDNNEILDLSPLGILFADSEQRINWCNQRFLEDTKLNKENVVGHLLAALPMEAIDKKTHLVQLFDKESSSALKFQYWRKESTSAEKGTLHYFALDRDATSKPSKLAMAKIPKRPSWVEFLDYEVSRSRRYDNPLCVLKLHIIIDHIPAELEEDDIKQAIKDTLQDELRWADMIGNTSRGSFLMVLPETPNSALEQLKGKISTAVEGQLKALSSEICYHIVFGSAYWKKHDDSNRLLKRARENLVIELEKQLNTSKE